MTFKEKLNADLIAAMRAKEELKVSVLRILKTSIMKFETAGTTRKEATDEDVLKIIGKEVKQRKDSIDAFTKGGREQLAAKENEEMKILQTYLPAQMSEDDLRAVVKQVISQTGATGKADFGKVIGAVMGQVKGKAEGQTVSRVVGEFLK
jgi:hypothetical protein